MATPPPVTNGIPATSRPEDRHDDRAAGEDHRLSCRCQGSADRFGDRHPLGQVLAVPGDQEERVVDADAEPDHGRQLRRPRRDVDQVGHQLHRGDADDQAEQRHPDRQPHRDEGAERDQQDDHRDDDPRDLAEPGGCFLEREEQVAAGLQRQRRLVTQVGDGVLEVVQVGLLEVLDRRVLHAHERDVTVRRDAARRTQHVRELREGGLHRRQLRRSVRRFEHDVSGDPALVGLGLGEQLRSSVGVEAGRLEALLEIAPEGDGGGDDDEREDDPGADGGPGPGGGRPAEPVEEIGHASTVARRRTIHIGPRSGGLLGRKDEKRLVLVPRTTRLSAL